MKYLTLSMIIQMKPCEEAVRRLRKKFSYGEKIYFNQENLIWASHDPFFSTCSIWLAERLLTRDNFKIYKKHWEIARSQYRNSPVVFCYSLYCKLSELYDIQKKTLRMRKNELYYN